MDPGKYDTFVTSYMDRITDSMSTKQKLRVLYGMIEKDSVEICNLRHSLTKDPEERLALIERTSRISTVIDTENPMRN